jgi:hypothetical protein
MDHILSSVWGSVLNIFPATLHIWRPFPLQELQNATVTSNTSQWEAFVKGVVRTEAPGKKHFLWLDERLLGSQKLLFSVELARLL